MSAQNQESRQMRGGATVRGGTRADFDDLNQNESGTYNSGHELYDSVVLVCNVGIENQCLQGRIKKDLKNMCLINNKYCTGDTIIGGLCTEHNATIASTSFLNFINGTNSRFSAVSLKDCGDYFQNNLPLSVYPIFCCLPLNCQPNYFASMISSTAPDAEEIKAIFAHATLSSNNEEFNKPNAMSRFIQFGRCNRQSIKHECLKDGFVYVCFTKDYLRQKWVQHNRWISENILSIPSLDLDSGSPNEVVRISVQLVKFPLPDLLRLLIYHPESSQNTMDAILYNVQIMNGFLIHGVGMGAMGTIKGKQEITLDKRVDPQIQLNCRKFGFHKTCSELIIDGRFDSGINCPVGTRALMELQNVEQQSSYKAMFTDFIN